MELLFLALVLAAVTTLHYGLKPILVQRRMTSKPAIAKTPARAKYVQQHIKIDDAAMDAGRDAYSLIAPIWWAGIDLADEQSYRTSTAPFPQPQLHLYAIFQYMAQVDNGGHDQFFFNHTGTLWQDARAGCQAIGLDEAAAILDEASARLGGSPSLDTATRREQLDELHPGFDDLDERFYALQKAVDINELMVQYILSNRSAFYFEGDVMMAEWAL